MAASAREQVDQHVGTNLVAGPVIPHGPVVTDGAGSLIDPPVAGLGVLRGKDGAERACPVLVGRDPHPPVLAPGLRPVRRPLRVDLGHGAPAGIGEGTPVRSRSSGEHTRLDLARGAIVKRVHRLLQCVQPLEIQNSRPECVDRVRETPGDRAGERHLGRGRLGRDRHRGGYLFWYELVGHQRLPGARREPEGCELSQQGQQTRVASRDHAHDTRDLPEQIACLHVERLAGKEAAARLPRVFFWAGRVRRRPSGHGGSLISGYGPAG
ncbi:hypothetical protein FRAHR75_1010003 [Frankia sp. Hr75.2]|nr:hypothetical protein FRAHR75_1010003 [Frankia sp. Hr75.2]